MTPTGRRGVARVAAVVLTAAALAVGMWPTSVSAHAALESSTPSANSVLESSPPEIVLDFDEEVESSLATIQLFDGDGGTVDVGVPAAGDDATVVTASLPTLEDGIYAVIWRVTSADGHSIDGAFSFQIGTAAAGDGQDLIDQVQDGAGTDPLVSWVYGVARFLALAGAMLAIGVGVWSLQGRPPLGGRPAVRAMLWVGWVTLLAGSVQSFLLFGAQSIGGDLTDAMSPDVWSDILHTQTGRMLLVRIVSSAVVGLAVLTWARHARTWWQGVAASAAVVTLVTFPAAGHPNAQSPRLAWIAVDLLHLSAVTVWIGGLFALLLAGRVWLAEPEAAPVVRRFSGTATVAIPVIVLTGIAQTMKLAGDLDDVTATTWGRVLLGKVMLAIVLIAIGGVSRWLLHHDGPASIRRTVVVEAVIGLIVIALAAAMLGHTPRPTVPAQPFEQSVTANGVIAEVSISPGRVGSNEVHVLITPPGGSITPVAAASARVSLPAEGIPLSPIELNAEGSNHYSGRVTFPTSGEWTLELIIDLTESDSALLKTTVPIP